MRFRYFARDEVQKDEWDELKPGDVFYWHHLSGDVTGPYLRLDGGHEATHLCLRNLSVCRVSQNRNSRARKEGRLVIED